MDCTHEGALTAQRRACGELAALGIPWQAECRCPACGRPVRLAWRAGRCAVWARRAAGFAFWEEVAAPDVESPPRAAGGLPARAPVLVVEDDRDTRELLRLALGTAGVAAAAVATGGEARRWLARRRPSLLLLDEELPDGRVDLLT